MKFSLKIGKIEEVEVEGRVEFAWEGESENGKWELGIRNWMEKAGFKGKLGEILVLPVKEGPQEKIFLVGLGKKEELTLGDLRRISATLGKRAKNEACQSIGLFLGNLLENDILSAHGRAEFPFRKTDDFPLPASSSSMEGRGIRRRVNKEFSLSGLSQAVVEGLLLGDYQFLKYKTKPEEKKELAEVFFLCKNAPELVSVKKGVSRGEIFSEAACFARDLVNEPSSLTTPTYLADLAQKLAKTGGVSCKVYDEQDIKKLSMGALLGVSRGSDEPARFIKLEYRGGKRKLVLVGKGITFDTGGLSLKKQEDMETMKMDMAGAAAILGIFLVVEKLRPKVHLIGLIPATENMPSGKAIKPGDIIKSYSGKTIEVLNTDAEGRLILADALAFGIDLKPDLMIDLATLTGACIVALGEEVAGLFSKDKKLAEDLCGVAEEVGEKFWPLPLESSYQELLKSEVADLKNVTGKKYAGAITAALFLEEFVGSVPWVHLDIAGPAWAEKGTDLIPKGGTGFGVRTILNFLTKYDFRD